jgi:hypothetical protein
LKIAVLAAALLAAGARADTPLLTPLAGAAEQPPAPWVLVTLPKQTKPVTRFSIAKLDGEPVLRIEANASYGSLGHPLADKAGTARTLAWRWRVDQPIQKANLRRRSGDDTAVKVCALFDLPDDQVPAADRAFMNLARRASERHVPAANICYVWDATLPAGTVLPNAFTGRVRYLVLHSKEAPLASWQEEKRDLQADFLRLFGEETTTVPRLVAIVIGGDADNTKSHSLAYVANLELSP